MMWIFLPIFFISDFIILNISKLIGTKIHKNSIKYGEILQENIIGMYHHVLSSTLLIYIMYTNNWCLNSDYTISFDQTLYCIEDSINISLYQLLYYFEMSHYITSLINTFFWKKIKRTDQTMHCIHHFITILLLYMGSRIKYGDFCTIYILFTHNLCDIPININSLIKTYKITNLKYNKCFIKIVEYINGILLILMWVYLRLYMYGSLTFAILYVFPDKSGNIMKCSISLLYFINIMWFYLILKSLYLKIKGDDESILYKDKKCSLN